MSTTFKGEKAILLSSDLYELTLLPERGAKIASIIYKPQQLEILSQISEPYYNPSADPSVGFTSQDSSGFDDMFPSILADKYEWETSEITTINDHGNVWYKQWSYNSISSKECLCSVEIPEFFCLLEKSIRITGNGIQVAYALTNKSHSPFKGLWAAHILFAMREGMYLKVDSSQVEIINVMKNSQLGEDSFGIRHTFSTNSDAWKNLSYFDPNSHSCAKYYFANPTDLSRCSLVDEQNNLVIHVDYDPKVTPYLGIWKNERGWENQMNVGIEPATSGMDSPSLAEKFGMKTIFPAKEVTVWNLQISCSQFFR